MSRSAFTEPQLDPGVVPVMTADRRSRRCIIPSCIDSLCIHAGGPSEPGVPIDLESVRPQTVAYSQLMRKPYPTDRTDEQWDVVAPQG